MKPVVIDAGAAPDIVCALRFGDNAMVLGQQVAAWTSHAPTVELDIALANQGLDLFGQANLFYDFAASGFGGGLEADDLAFWRNDRQYFNLLLVEQPNGDFGRTMARQFFYAAYARLVFDVMKDSSHEALSAIAAKGAKEMAYHYRHAGEWVVRLGDGTDESHRRMEDAVAYLQPFCGEMFMYDEADRAMVEAGVLPPADDLKARWHESVASVFSRAGLGFGDEIWKPEGGRRGIHTEHLSYLLAEMQTLVRNHPGAKW